MSRPEISREVWDTYAYGPRDETPQALEKLVVHYQYLVEGCARKLERKLPSYVEDDELISYGQVGLLKAIGKYDPNSGPFSRYASTVIYGAIIDGLREADFAPRGLRKQQRELEAVIASMQDDGLLNPTNKQIADYMGVPEKDLTNLQHRILKADVSPWEPDLMPLSKNQNPSLLSREICREFVVWLKKSDIMTQKIIALRYWGGLSVRKISDRLGEPVDVVRTKHQDFMVQVLPFVRELVTE